MKRSKLIAVCVAIYIAATVGVTSMLYLQNCSLRKENATLRSLADAKVRRPKIPIPPSSGPRTMAMPPITQGAPRLMPRTAQLTNLQPSTCISEDDINAAVKARLDAHRKRAEEERERRRGAIASMTPEQKAAQKDAFLERMRERSQRRLKSFVTNTGLNESQAAAFENTVAAMDATLRETANAYAEQIRKTGNFSRDAQVKFVGDVSAVVSAGYDEMDASLPETWRTNDGNVNLMEIVGPEALSSVVEALTESGLEDGLQTVGQVMGGPEGGGADGNEAPTGNMDGIESPGVGGGPGGGPR